MYAWWFGLSQYSNTSTLLPQVSQTGFCVKTSKGFHVHDFEKSGIGLAALSKFSGAVEMELVGRN